MTRLHSIDAVGHTFRDLKRHTSTTLFTAALLAAPALAEVLVRLVPGAPGTASAVVLRIGAQLIALTWLPVALIWATHQYATGEDPGVGGILKKSFDLPRLGAYLGLTILIILIIIGALLVAFIPTLGVFIAAYSGSGGDIVNAFRGSLGAALAATAFVSFVLAITLIIFFGLRYAVSGPAVILERISPIQALGRSRDLMREHRWDLILMWLIVGSIIGVLYLVLLGPGIFLSIKSLAEGSVSRSANPFGGFFDPFPAARPAERLVIGISLFLYQVASTPIAVGALTNFYLGLRGDEVAAKALTIGNNFEPRLGGNGQGDPGQQ